MSMVTGTHTTSKKYRLRVITSAPFYNENKIFMGENCERTQNRGRRKTTTTAREQKRKMTGTMTKTTERMRMIAMMMMMKRRRGLLPMRAMWKNH